MSAEDWMARGYLDAINKRDKAPPNYPIDAEAYDHGYQNGLDDRRKEPRAPAKMLRARANSIVARDALPPPPGGPT